MNHGSIFVSEHISCGESPRSSATNSQWMRSGRGVANFSRKQRCRSFRRCAPRRVRFERANAFLQRFLKRAADGHYFADGLHLRAERGIGSGKFLKLPLRDLHHHVVNRRLEAAMASCA